MASSKDNQEIPSIKLQREADGFSDWHRDYTVQAGVESHSVRDAVSRCRNVLTTVRQSLGCSDPESDPDILETANEVFTRVGSVLASFDTNDLVFTTTADDEERVKALKTAYTRVLEECEEAQTRLKGKKKVVSDRRRGRTGALYAMAVALQGESHRHRSRRRSQSKARNSQSLSQDPDQVAIAPQSPTSSARPRQHGKSSGPSSPVKAKKRGDQLVLVRKK
ncbi:hypothetical protein FFLO_01541 [Filobasidium floriforme]|uniref:Uncharacterized protein n=1 Tax=Filobasidium floriforme TaxID=5210 RepID=A0A8K0NPW7_9TREE|nr:uncharacterized protein HD553DRAFT_326528 [Filobasidium floriforme]KAG7562983.1 hypothetical protein FFLO_01541 [Filobasidium floriforme]KAH8079282.1 hypothetical protein HD553DRAFT_326528 [Filobasidium floriforme]